VRYEYYTTDVAMKIIKKNKKEITLILKKLVS
jgi:hypothetical protein